VSTNDAVNVAFVVAKGKQELRRVVVRVEGTTVVDSGDATGTDDADITFTMTEADAHALHDGDLDLSVGFMRGQIKMAGDFGKLLHFLPLTASDSPAVSVPSLL
jgi:putative sterol carrier protein